MIEDVDKIIWPKILKTVSVWNFYLFLGFSGLGINIKRSTSDWDIPDGVRGVMPIDIFWKSGDRQRIWYDFHDFPRQFYEKTVQGNDLYFKIMLRKEDTHYERLYPIGQTTAGGDRDLLARHRVDKKKQEFDYDVIGLFRQTDHGTRTKAVEIVKAQHWKSIVGMTHFRNRPPLPGNIRRRKYDYHEHLKLQSQSRICLDFPGVGGEWSWRWTEILGMGCFCLRTEPLHVCPGNPQNCWGEVKRDLSDLVEKIDYYLANDEARNEIAKNGMEYYEDYLSPEAQAKYVLNLARERRYD